MLRALRRGRSLRHGRLRHLERGGQATHQTWQSFLLDDKDDSPGSLIKGWRANSASSPLGMELRAVLEPFERLVEQCFDERQLIHSDLINVNVLAADGRITALLDLGSSIFGDALYDVAWFTFYQPWYPQFGEVDLSGHCSTISVRIRDQHGQPGGAGCAVICSTSAWTRSPTTPPGKTGLMPKRRPVTPRRYSIAGDNRQRREGCLRFPDRTGFPRFEHLDHAVARHVEVVARSVTMRQVVAGEGVDEGGVDSLGVEDVEQLSQVGRLLGLVANVVTVQAHRPGTVHSRIMPPAGARVGRSAERGAAELGDRERLAARHERADGVLVAIGHLDQR